MSNQPGPEQPNTPDNNVNNPLGDPAGELPNDPTAPSLPDYSDAAEQPATPQAPSADESAASVPAAPAEQPAAPSNPTPAGSVPPPPYSTEPVSEPASKTNSILKRIGVAIVAIAVVFGVRYFLSDKGVAGSLEVGQCVSRSGNEISAVDCTSADAAFKVLKIEKDVSTSDVARVCGLVEGVTNTYIESKKNSSTGNIICLGDPK